MSGFLKYAHSKTGEKPARSDRKIMVRNLKSGKEREVVFIPQKVADRLKEYINV